MTKPVIVMILSLAVLMLNAAGSIRMEDYAGAVCRVAIELDDNEPYRLSETSNSLAIISPGFRGKDPAAIVAEHSELITAFEIYDEVLKLNIAKPFRYESMLLQHPRKLVLDIFTSSPDKAPRLAIGDFYSEMGKFNSADKIYGALHHDYPDDAQILYHWALLLAKRKSARALEILMKIPESSAYFVQGQKLMAHLTGENDLPAPPPDEVTLSPEAVKLRDMVLPAPDSTASTPAPKISIPPEKIKHPPSFQLPLFALLCLLALVTIIATLHSFKRKKPERFDLFNAEADIPDENEETNKTLIRMVDKLLDDGWTHQEIAREMKLSLAQVERLVMLSQRRSGVDEY